uniref:NDR1/HIN1-like protein 1 n=1 Tax=Tanacetum cinerariifolium TaxID=118510 RepID=A0A699IHB9_TANCI|nr:NDR1/HIN1-like protein 1 [Tanacetum cinerariifolium]
MAAATTKVIYAANKVADSVKPKGGCFGWLHRYWKCITRFSLIFLVGFAIFITRAVLRPTKPQFTLQDMNLLTFNASSTAPTVTSIIQTTISSRNPNQRIAIYYEKLRVHIAYHTQPITSLIRVPPSFLGHKDVITWSPFLYGSDVPLAPDLDTTMSQDIQAEIVLVNVRASGIVRWKVGTIFGKYHIIVNCPTNIYFGKKDDAYIASPAIKYPLLEKCHVE